jgi:hypothetical protein
MSDQPIPLPQQFTHYKKVLGEVAFPGFTFQLFNHGPHYHLRVRCKGTCNVSGKPLDWSGRWWRLSPHMTPTEIVLTAFKAVLTALEHEAREQFTYKGVAVLDSHIDVEELVRIRSEEKLDARSNPHPALREKHSY